MSPCGLSEKSDKSHHDSRKFNQSRVDHHGHICKLKDREIKILVLKIEGLTDKKKSCMLRKLDWERIVTCGRHTEVC